MLSSFTVYVSSIDHLYLSAMRHGRHIGLLVVVCWPCRKVWWGFPSTVFEVYCLRHPYDWYLLVCQTVVWCPKISPMWYIRLSYPSEGSFVGKIRVYWFYHGRNAMSCMGMFPTIRKCTNWEKQSVCRTWLYFTFLCAAQAKQHIAIENDISFCVGWVFRFAVGKVFASWFSRSD